MRTKEVTQTSTIQRETGGIGPSQRNGEYQAQPLLKSLGASCLTSSECFSARCEEGTCQALPPESQDIISEETSAVQDIREPLLTTTIPLQSVSSPSVWLDINSTEFSNLFQKLQEGKEFRTVLDGERTFSFNCEYAVREEYSQGGIKLFYCVGPTVKRNTFSSGKGIEMGKVLLTTNLSSSQTLVMFSTPDYRLSDFNKLSIYAQ